MWRNTRYDLQDYSVLGLAPAAPTWGYPITQSGEDLMRAGEKWYCVGHQAQWQTFGAIWGVESRAQVDAHLNKLVSVGVNCLSIMTFEAGSLAASGDYAGKQLGCFDNGYKWSDLTSRNWSVGEVAWTTDSSNIRRVYECITAGVGTGSTGPTGTGSDITNGATHWRYLRLAFSQYSEAWFAGTSTTAGFDYFLDACGRRGIYVMLRFNHWNYVFPGRTGYPLNGSGLTNYEGCWGFDGEYSTPTLLTYVKDHLATFLDRVNTVNGLRYGDDATIAVINPWNEMGIAKWYFGTSSATGPSSDTFDEMCDEGSSTSSSDPANPTALFVAAWDSKFAAWYAATFGTTPSSDYGKLNTLPCNAYTDPMGANVAARNDYRSGATANDYNWRERVVRFLREAEADFAATMKTWLATKSSHALLLAGQYSYIFPTTHAQADICDQHYYSNSSDTSSNTITLTASTAPAAGMAYSAAAGGTITFTGMPSTDTTAHPLVVGAWVRWTLTSNPSITGVAQIATTGSPWTVTGVGADPGIGGTNVNCTVIIGTADKSFIEWAAEPPGNTSTTRTHVWMAGSSIETNADAVGGWRGSANYGLFYKMRNAHIQGKGKFTTEIGNRANAPPASSSYHVTHALFDLMLGGSGGARFAWIHSSGAAGSLEHSIPGDGSAMLSTALVSLLARYVTPFPTEDATQVTTDDIDEWYGKRNSTDGYSDISAGWDNLVTTIGATGFNTSYHAFMHNRLRTKIAETSAKTNVTYTHSSSGWTHPELTSTSTGRLAHNRDYGWVSYESAKLCLIAGRMRATTDTTELTKMTLSVIDGTVWCGLVAWVSLDGSDLGVGRSALFHWMYPRSQGMVHRRYEMSGRNQYVEMLDGDYGHNSDPQPGVVLRNGLEITLTTPQAMRATRYVQGVPGEYYASYSGGVTKLQPRDPLIILGPMP